MKIKQELKEEIVDILKHTTYKQIPYGGIGPIEDGMCVLQVLLFSMTPEQLPNFPNWTDPGRFREIPHEARYKMLYANNYEGKTFLDIANIVDNWDSE